MRHRHHGRAEKERALCFGKRCAPEGRETEQGEREQRERHFRGDQTGPKINRRAPDMPFAEEEMVKIAPLHARAHRSARPQR